jgi:hypothetical protein
MWPRIVEPIIGPIKLELAEMREPKWQQPLLEKCHVAAAQISLVAVISVLLKS